MQKPEVNENKQIEYTKELMKKIHIGRCIEVRNKYNSVIRTKGVNWACWDIQCGN